MPNRWAVLLRRMIRHEPVGRVTPDHELLCRYAAGDESAFTALVGRHGVMVREACRQILRDHHLAEEALQATFVVLARKASSLSRPGGVGGWLLVVARRIATRARKREAGRCERDRVGDEAVTHVDPSVGSEAQAEWRELLGILWEELGMMSAKYRDPLLACYIRDRTHDEAAAELGVSESTLRRRLRRGRELLRARLTVRGVCPAVGLFVPWALLAVPSRLPAGEVNAVLRVVLTTPTALAPAIHDLVLGEALMPRIPKKTVAIVGGLLGCVAGAVVAVGLLRGGADRDVHTPGTPPAEPADRAAGLATITLPRGEVVEGLSWLPDGRRVVVATGRTAHVADVRTGRILHTIPHGAAGWTIVAPPLVVSADGRHLATVRVAGADERDRGSIELWDLATGTKVATWAAHPSQVCALAFSPDGAVLASAGEDWVVKLWDVTTRRELATLDEHALRPRGTSAAGITELSFSPDGRHLVSAGHLPPVVTRGPAFGQDGEFILWDVRAKARRAAVRVPRADVTTVVWLPDGQSAALAWGDYSASVVTHLDVETGRQSVLRDALDRPLAVTRDGRLVGVGRQPAAPGVEVWDTRTGKRTVALSGSAAGVAELAVHPTRQWVAAAGRDGTVRVWRLDGVQPAAELAGHAGRVRAVAWSPDGAVLASGGEDGTVRLWGLAAIEAALPVSAPPPEPKPAAGPEQLTGDWDLVACEEEGKRVDLRKDGRVFFGRLEVTRDTFAREVGAPFAGGNDEKGRFQVVVAEKGVFQVDVEYVRRSSDDIRPDQSSEHTGQELWELVDQDTLRVCRAPGKSRPDSFTTEKGDGRATYEYQRAKGKKNTAAVNPETDLTGTWSLAVIEKDGGREPNALLPYTLTLDARTGAYKKRSVVFLAGGSQSEGTFRIVGTEGGLLQVDLDYEWTGGVGQDDRPPTSTRATGKVLWQLVDRNTLRTCGEPGKDRPTAMTTRKGDGQVVYEFTRVVE